MDTYTHAVLGGTFDHLHAGHHSHLHAAASCAPRLTIGLTSDEMIVKKSFAQALESYEVRRAGLSAWFAEHAPKTHYEIVAINDIYGPAGHVAAYDVLVATASTQANAALVNKQREASGVAPLPVVLAQEIPADDGVLISSTRIRAGEIDRDGHLYTAVFSRDLQLPTTLRATLQKPMGQLFVGTEVDLHIAQQACLAAIGQAKPPLVVAVGDIVSRLVENVIDIPTLSVIDYVTKRVKTLEVPHTYDVQNPASTIRQTAAHLLVEHVRDMQTRAVIRVEGEEDLLVIPAVLAAPLQSMVIYGQPDEGIVAITVTEEKKQEVLALTKQFE